MAQALDPPAIERDRAPKVVGSPPGKLFSILLWVGLSVVLLVGLYAAAGYWLVPRVARSLVVSQVEERYHRKASIGEVTLNPFTLHLTAARFSLPDADGKSMLGFRRLAVDLSLASLWRGGPVFRSIELDAPTVRVVRRANGRINLQDLARKPGGPNPRVFIDNLWVRRGEAQFLDLARPTPFSKSFRPTDLTLRHFSTVKRGATYTLTAMSERNEALVWHGTFNLDPLMSRGGFTLTDVQVAPLMQLAPGALPFRITGGELRLSGAYDFALRGKALTLRVNVPDMRLSGAGLRAEGADADWVTLPLVTVSNLRADVPAQTLAVGRVEAVAPVVTAWTVGGGVNLARYGGTPGAAQAPPALGAAQKQPWKVELPDLRVRGAKVSFEERSLAKPLRVAASALDVTVTGFALPTVQPVGIEGSAVFDDGSRLSVKGPVTLGKQLAADIQVAASGIGLPRFQPYIDHAVGLRLLSGKISANGRLSYAARGDSGGVAKFDGVAQVDNLHTVDKVLQQDFVNWRSLRAEGLNVVSSPLFVKVREVVALEPYAKVVIGPDTVLNVTTVLNANGGAPPQTVAVLPAKVNGAGFALFPKAQAKPRPRAPPRQPRSEPLPVEIGRVTIHKGEMDFADLTLTPNFAAGIHELDGAVSGLSPRQDTRATVKMAGQVGSLSPVTIDGAVNYFAVHSITDVSMTFRNIEMTTLSPYAGKFAGYRINRGKLNVDLHYDIKDALLNANHKVVIDQLQLGEKVESPDAVKLPVKLVVALLRDRNGVINLPIEIRGTLDDPKFKIWPVIWQVVKNLMGKVAAAPFTALGAILGGGDHEDLQYIEFLPGSAAIDEGGERKIASLSKALADKPGVRLEAPMVVDPALDREALTQARLEARLVAASAKMGKPGTAPDLGNDPAKRRTGLEALYRQEFSANPDLPKPPKGQPKPESAKAAVEWLEAKLKARMAVTDNDLEALGRERAQAVQAALIEKGRVDASRVFITAPQAKDEKALKAKTGQPTGTLKTDLNPSAGAGMPKGGPERGVVRMELALS
jgi:hypothetical protein